MADELASGVAIAVVVDVNVSKLREFCGPYDPDVAKIIYPETLRAKYGKTIVKNAVHCTDIDAKYETEFLEILSN